MIYVSCQNAAISAVFFFKKTQIHGMWPLTPRSASSFFAVMWPLDRFLSPLIFQ
jgi:hypothetical protein